MKIIVALVATAAVLTTVAPAQAQPIYKASYDADRKAYCIRMSDGPDGRLRNVVPGPRCRSKGTWEAMGLRIEHRRGSETLAAR